MSPVNEQLHQELAVVLGQIELTDVDLFDLLGYFASVQPDMAHALCYHIRDILGETEEDADYSQVVTEAYRRAFFDEETAKRYGTAHYAASTATLRLMVDTFKTQYDIATRPDTSNVVMFRAGPATVQ